MIAFELIKERIQKFTLSSILHHCFAFLNTAQRTNDLQAPVWNLLSLIKWAYLHTCDSKLRKRIKQQEFEHLILLIAEFEFYYPGLNFTTRQGVDQSFKIIAYQQFYLQENFHPCILSRQLILYTELRHKFDIDKEFECLSGITLISFLTYTYFTYFFLFFDKLGQRQIEYEGVLPSSYFEIFVERWSEEELVKYLNLITIHDKNNMQNLQKLSMEIMQLFETNFFTVRPFIFFKGEYRIAHRAIFCQTIRHFVYDYLKLSSKDFSREFGSRMEKYLALGLSANQVTFLDENALKQKYSLEKVCDYLIDTEILVEAKAIEIHPRAAVMRTKPVLSQELSSSIVKAYIQLLSTAVQVSAGKEKYGIIITYKEMYLGFGADAWKEFMREPVEKYCAEADIDISVLPPSNLFFITIDDWDDIMQAIKSKGVTFKEVLKKAKEMNELENIAERLGMMSQVLRKYFSVSNCTLEYLKDGYKRLKIV